MAMSLGDLGKMATRIGQDAIKKTQQFADVTALKLKLEETKNVTDNLYKQLGAVYFKHCQDPSYSEALEQLCEQVAQSLAHTEEISAQIQAIQTVRRCTQCGGEIPNNAAFCTDCGTRMIALRCASCGAALLEGAKFCNECGAKNDN